MGVPTATVALTVVTTSARPVMKPLIVHGIRVGDIVRVDPFYSWDVKVIALEPNGRALLRHPSRTEGIGDTIGCPAHAANLILQGFWANIFRSILLLTRPSINQGEVK